MRVQIPQFANKSDLHRYLVSNKSKLISQKKSMPIFSDSCSFGIAKVHSTEDSFKANTPVFEDVDTLRVKVVANTANWIDSYFDMLLPDCWKRSIQQRKSLIPHLHDHIHQLAAKVGEVVDIYSSTMSLTELGLNKQGTTQSLLFITDIIKSYNEKVFNQYKLGKVKQHSIGMQYVELELAINDPDSQKEMDFWEKYYPQVINKEVADEYGFFWVVPEIKLLENSGVLFGANELTPTLDNNLKIESPNGTQNTKSEPSTDTRLIEALKQLEQLTKI